jgi:hypothetical protein
MFKTWTCCNICTDLIIRNLRAFFEVPGCAAFRTHVRGDCPDAGCVHQFSVIFLGLALHITLKITH